MAKKQETKQEAVAAETPPPVVTGPAPAYVSVSPGIAIGEFGVPVITAPQPGETAAERAQRLKDGHVESNGRIEFAGGMRRGPNGELLWG